MSTNIETLCQELAEGTDKHARCEAARLLGESGDPCAAGPLRAVLDPQNLDVTLAAVRALGKLKDSHAVEPLRETFWNTRHEKVEYSVVDALGEIGDTQAIEFLCVLLRLNRDNLLREHVIRVLEKTGDTRALSALGQTWDDPILSVRRDGARAIDTITRANGTDFLVRSPVRRIVQGTRRSLVVCLLVTVVAITLWGWTSLMRAPFDWGLHHAQYPSVTCNGEKMNRDNTCVSYRPGELPSQGTESSYDEQALGDKIMWGIVIVALGIVYLIGVLVILAAMAMPLMSAYDRTYRAFKRETHWLNRRRLDRP